MLGRNFGDAMKIKLIFLLAATSFSLTVVPFVHGIPEYSNKEKVTCESCHTFVGKAELNDVGKYYKEHRTLKGYPPKKRF
jgi:hypothetical protein